MGTYSLRKTEKYNPAYLNNRIFNDFTYEFEEGKIYCLKGKNGEGKSTFIDLLLGLDLNFKGDIEYNTSNIRKLDMINIRKNQISVIVQEPRMQRLSVKDNITRGIREYSEESLNELIDIFGLRGIIELEESLSLSGGEKKNSFSKGTIEKIFIYDIR
ncbi:MAG: ATP-binding cassette domain-containing protein [Candidatus Izemoplasmatales bacterium]|nr:ATP-binding cassette domain-containing protein [Candidatus Izemoplasmatales bacterium]